MNKLNQGILVTVVGLSSACIVEDSCIAEGTMIGVPAGLVPIESLRVGDHVYAFDISTNALVKTSITEVRSAKRECIGAGLGDGESLRCTPDHPLYDPEAKEYAPASEWIEGRRRRLLRVPPDGPPHEISVHDQIVHSGVFEVFDLTVESEHHNYVAAGVLVHNKSFDDTLRPEFPLSGTTSDTDGDTDPTGEQSSTGGDTTGGPTESSSGTGGSGSGATGSSSGSGGSVTATGSSGTSGSSGAGG